MVHMLERVNKFNKDGQNLFQMNNTLITSKGKCCTQYASKFGKLSSGHRTGKDQFSFQSLRKEMPKNVQIMYNCTHFTS